MFMLHGSVSPGFKRKVVAYKRGVNKNSSMQREPSIARTLSWPIPIPGQQEGSQSSISQPLGSRAHSRDRILSIMKTYIAKKQIFFDIKCLVS